MESFAPNLGGRGGPPASACLTSPTPTTEAAAQMLREEVCATDPNVPLYRMSTLKRAVDDTQWNGSVSNYLGFSVCLLSVLVAIVGVYSTTAQSVTLKTREIGLRMAVGAESV